MAIRILRSLLREEQGQDLIEFTLLVAFIAMTSSALFIGAGQSTRQIWERTDDRLEQASKVARGGGQSEGKPPSSIDEHPLGGGG